MTDLLDIRNLTIAFGTEPAVKDISFGIGRQETVALIGESGSGKSATALSILRLNPPSTRITGRILFEGKDILGMTDPAIRRLRGNAISMVFQEPMVSLNPVLTVGEQVEETLRRHRQLSRAEARAEAIRLLDLVRLPQSAHMIHRYPGNLSGGQRQRVMIAIAVACGPRLLIADEPTTALDVTIQSEILNLIDGLKRDLSMSVLLITHDLSVVGQWADRINVMNSGRILESGPVGRVLSKPEHPYTKGLLGASLRLDDTRHYTTVKLPEIHKIPDPLRDGGIRFDLVTPAAGTIAARCKPDGRAPDATPLLSVRDLKVAYQERARRPVNAINGVSFDLKQGETLGLVGESGCGKSTLCKAILQLVPVAAGEIVFSGTDIVPLKGKRLSAHRGQIQLVFQDPYGSLNPRRSVFDVLDQMQRLRGVSDKKTRLNEARNLLNQVGLPTSALHRFPHEFSGGQRQRICIARALIQKPRLIICDEPVSALDVSVQAQILNLLSDLKDLYDLSYLFISHDLSVVRYFTDRVIVMHGGRFVEEGSPQDIWTRATNNYTRRLIASVPGTPGLRAPAA